MKVMFFIIFLSTSTICLADQTKERETFVKLSKEELNIDGVSFLGQTGEEAFSGSVYMAKKRANLLCKYLSYPDGVFSYELERTGESKIYITLINDEEVRSFHSEHIWSDELPRSFRSISCKH